MNREALNMALQALETLMIERGSIYDKAIIAIKEALADPSPNFNCKSVQARLATAWGYVKAQPEQEPVAILHRYPSKCRMTVEYTDEITEVREGSWPLYTTPPQRKPLSDEEIILIVAECAASHQHTDIHFARAIERAHGIKGEA